MAAPLETDVIIVGGGLAGLSLADHLERAGVKYHVFDARERLGGRIKTCDILHSDRTGTFDLGPAWYWPGQPRMAQLVKRFAVPVFEQYALGLQSSEDALGAVTHGQGMASMDGSYRLIGGMSALIAALSSQLSATRVSIDTPIRALRRRDTIEGMDAQGNIIVRGRRVVLALPPRLTESMQFDPNLPQEVLACAKNIPTWMAGHAKVLAIYAQPFWREQGFSGDAMSRKGPLVEIHDASDPRSELGALFGFVGVPPHKREGLEEDLKQAVLQQLQRIFGKAAADPIAIVLQDWAFEPETATSLDLAAMTGHPRYGRPALLKDVWDGYLQFASAEMGVNFGGYLEGALEAAEYVAGTIDQTS